PDPTQPDAADRRRWSDHPVRHPVWQPDGWRCIRRHTSGGVRAAGAALHHSGTGPRRCHRMRDGVQSANAAVVFQDVSKTFGHVLAVNHLNLKVAQGEFLVLLGPSGCGKTTSLRMLAGLERISSGTISIGESGVHELP